jgi:hypothetical protein
MNTGKDCSKLMREARESPKAKSRKKEKIL